MIIVLGMDLEDVMEMDLEVAEVLEEEMEMVVEEEMGEVVELEVLGELVGLEEQDHQALTVTVLGMGQVVVEMEVEKEDKEEMEMEGELVMEVEVVVEELVELVVWAVLVALDGLVQSQTVYGTVQEGVMGKKEIKEIRNRNNLRMEERERPKHWEDQRKTHSAVLSLMLVLTLIAVNLQLTLVLLEEI